MSNLARPPELPPFGGPVDQVEELLDDVRRARAGRSALPGLRPTTYARAHAAFELLSDQRDLITAHLLDHLVRRGHEGPVSVLSVGCGDGSLDAPLAAALADARPERPVRYVGVEPFEGSARAFAAALDDLGRPGLAVEVHTAVFEDLPAIGSFDVVMFVHSLYYVRDVAATLRAAYALLRPGGDLVVLSAPRAELNALVEVLAPPLEGHEQWFSDDVATALQQTGLPAEAPWTLRAGFDAGSASDEVLDFAVQARLTEELRPLVRAYLDAVAELEPDSGRRVPHPVEVFCISRAY